MNSFDGALCIKQTDRENSIEEHRPKIAADRYRTSLLRYGTVEIHDYSMSVSKGKGMF